MSLACQRLLTGLCNKLADKKFPRLLMTEFSNFPQQGKIWILWPLSVNFNLYLIRQEPTCLQWFASLCSYCNSLLLSAVVYIVFKCLDNIQGTVLTLVILVIVGTVVIVMTLVVKEVTVVTEVKAVT